VTVISPKKLLQQYQTTTNQFWISSSKISIIIDLITQLQIKQLKCVITELIL